MELLNVESVVESIVELIVEFIIELIGLNSDESLNGVDKIPNSGSLNEMMIRHTMIPIVKTRIVFLEHKTSEIRRCNSQRIFNEMNCQ